MKAGGLRLVEQRVESEDKLKHVQSRGYWGGVGWGGVT